MRERSENFYGEENVVEFYERFFAMPDAACGEVAGHILSSFPPETTNRAVRLLVLGIGSGRLEIPLLQACLTAGISIEMIAGEVSEKFLPRLLINLQQGFPDAMFTTLSTGFQMSVHSKGCSIRVSAINADCSQDEFYHSLPDSFRKSGGGVDVVLALFSLHFMEKWRYALLQSLALLATGGIFVYCEEAGDTAWIDNCFANIDYIKGMSLELGKEGLVRRQMLLVWQWYHGQRTVLGKTWNPVISSSNMTVVTDFLHQLERYRLTANLEPFLTEWAVPGTFTGRDVVDWITGRRKLFFPVHFGLTENDFEKIENASKDAPECRWLDQYNDIMPRKERIRVHICRMQDSGSTDRYGFLNEILEQHVSYHRQLTLANGGRVDPLAFHQYKDHLRTQDTLFSIYQQILRETQRPVHIDYILWQPDPEEPLTKGRWNHAQHSMLASFRSRSRSERGSTDIASYLTSLGIYGILSATGAQRKYLEPNTFLTDLLFSGQSELRTLRLKKGERFHVTASAPAIGTVSTNEPSLQIEIPRQILQVRGVKEALEKIKAMYTAELRDHDLPWPSAFESNSTYPKEIFPEHGDVQFFNFDQVCVQWPREHYMEQNDAPDFGFWRAFMEVAENEYSLSNAVKEFRSSLDALKISCFPNNKDVFSKLDSHASQFLLLTLLASVIGNETPFPWDVLLFRSDKAIIGKVAGSPSLSLSGQVVYYPAHENSHYDGNSLADEEMALDAAVTTMLRNDAIVVYSSLLRERAKQDALMNQNLDIVHLVKTRLGIFHDTLHDLPCTELRLLNKILAGQNVLVSRLARDVTKNTEAIIKSQQALGGVALILTWVSGPRAIKAHDFHLQDSGEPRLLSVADIFRPLLQEYHLADCAVIDETVTGVYLPACQPKHDVWYALFSETMDNIRTHLPNVGQKEIRIYAEGDYVIVANNFAPSFEARLREEIRGFGLGQSKGGLNVMQRLFEFFHMHQMHRPPMDIKIQDRKFCVCLPLWGLSDLLMQMIQEKEGEGS